MQCGDVYGFRTHQAPNHQGKYKLHVCVCLKPDLLFLLVNSSGDRSHSMTITPDDWPQMPKKESFISLDFPIAYKQKELENAKFMGRLSDDALNRLMNEVSNCPVLTGEQKDYIIDGIDGYGLGYRIDSLVEWFHKHYQDPAHEVHYSTKGGGYQWRLGEPYDASEVLADNFPEEFEEIIDAAVKKIQSGGIVDWAAVGSPSDHLPFFDEDDLARNSALQEIATELDSLITDLPTPQVDPAFNFGDDGVLHFISPPDLQATPSGDEIFKELNATAHDLGQELIGSNAYTDLSGIVEQYNQALSDEQISISRLYALGIKLENVASATKRSIEAEDLPAFPLNVDHNLDSAIELHRTYIMSQEEGRNLAEAASAYSQPPQQTEKLREAGKQISDSVANNPDLFREDVKKLIASVVEDIGRGEQPEKSNQVATNTIYNLGSSMLLRTGGIGAGVIIMALMGEMVAGSVPGAAVIAIGSEKINAVWYFLSTNLTSFKVIAEFASFDASWITRFSDLLGRLKELIKPR